jgi:integrase
LHLLVMLAAVAGARRTQLLGLRWHNVQLDNRRVSFCAGRVEGPDGPVLAATKTRRKHSVDLDATTCALLARHALDCGGRDDGFVFSDDGGLTAWKPTGSPRRSSAAAGPLASALSVCMTCATSW